MAQRLVLENWAPEYGAPFDAPEDEGDIEIDASVEVDAGSWRPIAPAEPAAQPLLAFVDGVRRIDAHGFVDDGVRPARPVLLASFAAGVVRVGVRAKTEAIDVRRAVFGRAPLEPVATRAGVFESFGTAGDSIEELSHALQERLGLVEIEVAGRVDGADLTIVDGPLYGRQHLPDTVGYIKTHRVQYLQDDLVATIARLAPGERTPLFLFRKAWTRYSWYLRLPCPVLHTWSGIVRLELAADQRAEHAIAIADLTASVLPRFASVPHKDPRAPQNLFPIAGLERDLRRRLGDPLLISRWLRTAT